MENMQKDIQDLKVTTALMEQRQEQMEEVVKTLTATLGSLEKKITQGFFIAIGMFIATSESTSDVAKVVMKYIGG